MRASVGGLSRPFRWTLAAAAERRYSLRVRKIRSSMRSLAMVACTALAVSCARSAPPPELPITARVIVSRVISEDVPSRPTDCAIETIAALPTQSYRELGTIEISTADPARHDTRVIINQHACAMGADAVLMNPASSQGGRVEATAIAYASGLAERLAKLRVAKEAADRPPPSLPKAPVPEVEQITPAGSSPTSSATEDDTEEELPPETLVPIRELQIGPVEAPSPTPTPPMTGSVTPVSPSASAALAPAQILTRIPPAQGLPPVPTARLPPVPITSPSP